MRRGKELEERDQKAREKAEALAADQMFLTCKRLKDLWIGDRCNVTAVRDDQGDIKELKWERDQSRRSCSCVHEWQPSLQDVDTYDDLYD